MARITRLLFNKVGPLRPAFYHTDAFGKAKISDAKKYEIILSVDGSYRKDEKVGGTGFYVFDNINKKLMGHGYKSYSGFNDTQASTVMEARALLNGLRYAKNLLGLRKVSTTPILVRVDCRGVIFGLRKGKKKNKGVKIAGIPVKKKNQKKNQRNQKKTSLMLSNCFSDIRKELMDFSNGLCLKWVNRSENGPADSLASAASFGYKNPKQEANFINAFYGRLNKIISSGST